jgi:hypothetical protein
MNFSGWFWNFLPGTLAPAANRLFYATRTFRANGLNTSVNFSQARETSIAHSRAQFLAPFINAGNPNVCP